MPDLLVSFTTITCYQEKCGIVFAVPDWWHEKRRRDHSTWCCPNGHRQCYPTGGHDLEKKVARAEREQVRLRAALDQERAGKRHAQKRAEHARRSAGSLRGWITRLKHRIANGVCPCCKRSFVNVRRHIKGQHPKFVKRWGAALTGREASAGT